MQVRKSSVALHDIQLYAFHGVLPQERKVGGWYRVNLSVDYPCSKASVSDCVEDALNYADLLNIVKQEMAQPSNLLEHVARRICEAIFQAYPLAEEITITLRKECPPMGTSTSGASVTLKAHPGPPKGRDAD